MKLWQWLLGLFLTAIIAIGGSLWSVGVMRADDMQRVATLEEGKRTTERELTDIRASQLRTELAIEEIRREIISEGPLRRRAR